MVDVLMGWLVKQSVDYGRMVEILVQRAASADEFTRLTSITWVNEFVKLGGEHLVPYYGDILGAILPAISDKEEKIRVVGSPPHTIYACNE
jgi:vacuole morphology and inheritance protein 14